MCIFLCEGLRLCLRCCGTWPELTDTNIYDIVCPKIVHAEVSIRFTC